MKKKVAIVYGGYSSESQISKKSALTIFEHTDKDLFEPFLVEIGKENWNVEVGNEKIPIDKNKFTSILNGKELSFDLAFITIHGTPGEDGKLPAYFDMIGIPYVNSGCFAASLSFNKWACNLFLNAFDISTAKSILLRKGEKINAKQIGDELGFPCFVKPNDGGSSYGISKVKKEMEIVEAIKKAFEEGDEVIIEAFIEGREFTCGLYKISDEIITLPPTEVIPENEFFDHAGKYLGKSQEITPANLSAEQTAEMQEIAKRAYQKLGLKGMARIDFMLHPFGTFFIIEVNTNPGMTNESIIPQQIRADGKTLKEVLTALIQDK